MRGPLEKQQTAIKFWKKHYAVLNNGFIFFFSEDDDQGIHGNVETDKINKNLDKLFSEQGLELAEDWQDKVSTEHFSISGCSQVEVVSMTCISLENGWNEKCEL